MNRLFLACGAWLIGLGFALVLAQAVIDYPRIPAHPEHYRAGNIDPTSKTGGAAPHRAVAYQSPRDCTIHIEVEAGPDLAVTIPCVKRNDVTEIVSAFFARGDEAQAEKFRKFLATAKHVTLTMTTKDGEK